MMFFEAYVMPLVLELFSLIFHSLYDTAGACPRSETTRSALLLPRSLLLRVIDTERVTARSSGVCFLEAWANLFSTFWGSQQFRGTLHIDLQFIAPKGFDQLDCVLCGSDVGELFDCNSDMVARSLVLQVLIMTPLYDSFLFSLASSRVVFFA